MSDGTIGEENYVVRMPSELLAEARRVADEEQRTLDELVSDAVRVYLRDRRSGASQPDEQNLTQSISESPFAGANLGIELRKEVIP